ncbi:hypothetical protein LXL04_017300 [Taraxacum kok-saghyz]
MFKLQPLRWYNELVNIQGKSWNKMDKDVGSKRMTRSRWLHTWNFFNFNFWLLFAAFSMAQNCVGLIKEVIIFVFNILRAVCLGPILCKDVADFDNADFDNVKEEFMHTSILLFQSFFSSTPVKATVFPQHLISDLPLL